MSFLKETYGDPWYPYRWTKQFFIDLGPKVPSCLLKDIHLKMTPSNPTVAGKSPSSKCQKVIHGLPIEYFTKITTTLIEDLRWSLVFFLISYLRWPLLFLQLMLLVNFYLQNCVWVTSGLPIYEQNYFFELVPKVTFGLIINILLRVTPGLYRLTELLFHWIRTWGDPGLPTVAEFCWRSRSTL